VIDKEKIESYRQRYYQNMLPVPFRVKDTAIKEGTDNIYIYPVLVKDWTIFENSYHILTIDKSKYNDISIIQMSYLEFLCKVLFHSEMAEEYKIMLSVVFSITLKDIENYRVRVYDNKLKLVLIDNKGNEYYVTPKEFNEIIDIIMTYNFVDYSDEKISDELQASINEYYSITNRGVHTPTLEEKKAYYLSKTGIDYNSINMMPYRLFNMSCDYLIGVDTYIGDRILQASEKYKVDDVLHPLYKPKTDIYSTVLSDAETFKNKVALGAKA